MQPGCLRMPAGTLCFPAVQRALSFNPVTLITELCNALHDSRGFHLVRDSLMLPCRGSMPSLFITLIISYGIHYPCGLGFSWPYRTLHNRRTPFAPQAT